MCTLLKEIFKLFSLTFCGFLILPNFLLDQVIVFLKCQRAIRDNERNKLKAEKNGYPNILDKLNFLNFLCGEPGFEDELTEPLSFVGCYEVKDQHLLRLLENGFPFTALDLNHCYWFGKNALKQVINQGHLRNLHLIECDIDEGSIIRILRLNLNALSISWNNNWGKILSENVKVDGNGCFKHLKELTVFHGANEDYVNFVYKFKTQMLVYCNELRYLKIYESRSQRNLDFKETSTLNLNIDCEETTPVPKLTHLIINFYRYGTCQSRINYLINVIFNNKIIPMEEIDLGENGFHAILNKQCENYEFNKYLERLKPEALSTVCFSKPPSQEAKNLREYMQKVKREVLEFEKNEIWADEHLKMNESHFNFEKFVMKNAKVNNFQALAEVIADRSDRIKHLDLHGLFVSSFERRYKHFEEGFKTITLSFPQLTYLDLTVDEFCLCSTQTNLSILRAIANLTVLKTLKLPSLIFCDDKRKPIEFNDISNGAREKSALWDITFKCKNIEELHIVSIYYPRDLFCPEYTLACIANLKKLKELHLINVPTSGANFSLPIIAAGCPLLKTFSMKNLYVGTKEFDNDLLERAIFHMKNIEDLCIDQALNLSETFIDRLCDLPRLKRLMLENCVATPEICNYFSDSLLKMEKLVAFCFIHSPEILAIRYFTKNVKRLRRERTPFSFLISSPIISDGVRKIAMLSWPAFHEPLRRYSKVQILPYWGKIKQK